MDITLLNLVWACVLFVLLISSAIGSYCILKRPVLREGYTNKKKLFVSLVNCFACGIFISVCFLGLLPHLKKHEEYIRRAWASPNKPDVSSYRFLNSEFIILIGFLFILLIEQAIHMYCDFNHHEMVGSHGESSSMSLNMFAAEVERPSEYVGELSTLLKCDEDFEPLIPETAAISAFNAEKNDMPAIKFRQSFSEVWHLLLFFFVSMFVVNLYHNYLKNQSLILQAFRRHCHVTHRHTDLSSSNMTVSILVMLCGLSSHSVFEGIALGMQSTTADFYGLLIAVMLHEVLCAFAFGVSIAQQRVSSKKAVIFSVIFAGSIPLGMSSSVFIGSSEALTASLFRFILEGFAAGAFIYVAFIEMLSSELNHSGQNSKAGFYKVLAVITGVFIFFIVNSVCHEHLHPFPQNTPLKTTVGKFPIDAY